MKRFHVHVAVDDLPASIRFYAALFASEPTVVKPDYAKWMLDDPRVNFAISQRGGTPGIRHLGIQVEGETELAEMYGHLRRAERPVLEEKDTTSCYAQSDKQWIVDPQGVAWETFLTKGETTVYGQGVAIESLGASAAPLCCGSGATPPATAPASLCGCGASGAGDR
jgi:catechol 2,3-dioxygenase-like lactoylglutathione lyase family enzyme